MVLSFNLFYSKLRQKKLIPLNKSRVSVLKSQKKTKMIKSFLVCVFTVLFFQLYKVWQIKLHEKFVRIFFHMRDSRSTAHTNEGDHFLLNKA